MLATGIKRVVIGNLAVKDQPLVQNWLKQFGPEHIVLAFDVRLDDKGDPEILTHGWQSGSAQSLWQVLQAYADSGLKTVLCTDVSRDGMLTGTNLRALRSVAATLAEAGYSRLGRRQRRLADLMQLAKLKLAGAIVGKAIYEGRVDLAAAIKQVSHAG